MDNLSNDILSYYSDRMTDLPEANQFHFTSRLHLWHSSPATSAAIERLRPWFTADNHPERALEALTNQADDLTMGRTKNAVDLRQQYFARYPTLQQHSLLLYWTLFLHTVYGLDYRQFTTQLVGADILADESARLLSDPPAIAALSSYASNFLYIYERFFQEHEGGSLVDTLGSVIQQRPEDSSLGYLLARAYFYSHCIIGETLLYARLVPTTLIDRYLVLLSRLEQFIERHYDRLNLDNKLELLVCCRLLNHQTDIETRIYEECANSLSDHGTFLIDRHNAYGSSSAKKSFADSEHRNVLFIMSTWPTKLATA